jgi:DNA-binding NtrC family response regulator
MKSGASDYITKPFSFDEIEIVLNRIHKETRMTRKIAVLETELKGIRSQSEFCNMIGKSEVMNKLYDLIDRIAASPATVLITGESGTGKELVANALHMKSPRNMGPLIKLNCAAMPETLLESELFGHEKGAFTNAYIKKTGHFELADGGTIFLDEIGEIPISTQAKLLRVLQEKTFTRVGGMKPVSVDVRIIAATNQNLEEAVKKGQFRQDLFFRLNVLPLKLPPLRERKGDVRLLARHFLSLFGQQNNRDFQDFENSALEKLIDYNWPGTVRELMNVIERLVVLNDGKLVTDEMLPLELSDQSFGIMEGDLPSPTAQMKEVEAWHIKRVVENVDHNLSRAARTLGIDRKTLYNKIERYGLTVIDND